MFYFSVLGFWKRVAAAGYPVCREREEMRRLRPVGVSYEARLVHVNQSWPPASERREAILASALLQDDGERCDSPLSVASWRRDLVFWRPCDWDLVSWCV